MKTKYSKSLILNYVNGTLELEEEKLEELENDLDFMMQVIEFTKDIKMYHMCSENLKLNFNFIEFLIKTFPNEDKFLEKAIEKFLSQKGDRIIETQIRILMQKQTQNEDKKYECALKNQIFYLEIKNVINSHLEKEKDNLGIGFILVKTLFDNSPIIQEFIANKMLDEIFYQDSKYTLEELLHKQYRKKEDIKDDLKGFIISYIMKKDECLGMYVVNNKDLILEFEKTLQKAIRNWDNYMYNLNESRMDIIYQEVDKLLDSDITLGIRGYQILDDTIKEMGIDSSFCFMEEFSEEEKLTPNSKLTFQELAFKKKVVKLLKTLFSEDVIDKTPTDYEEYQTEPLRQKKVVRLHFNQITKGN